MPALELWYTFLIGATIYGAIELLFRGRTHWTMLLTGGVCFAFLYFITTRTQWPILIVCLLGALFITAMEFLVGCIVNLRLRWQVWDYSNSRFHVLGQICPAFSLCWFLLCIPGVWLSNVIFLHLRG